jgi:putative copper resistance protein D
MNKAELNLHNALALWQWEPFSLCALAVLAGLACWYLRADWLLAARGHRWRGWRTVAFLSGLVAVDLAVQSPVATFTSSYFQAHILQHLLLMVVAPPLFALGAPSTLLLQTASRRTKVRWLAVLRSWPFAILTHPFTAWLLYFGVMFAFFLSSLINTAMHDMALMDLMNVVFLLGGCVYWWPLVGADPIVHWRMGYGARMLNVLLGAPFEAFLGIAIMFQRTPIASIYTLASTHAGGAMLWISTEVATAIGFAPIFLQWTSSEERAAVRADARAARLAPGQPGDRPPLGAAKPAAPSGDLIGAMMQPGNSTWEAMWLAKAGFVPSQDRRPAAGQGKRSSTER